MADIETIINQVKLAKANGWIVLEHGYDQGQLVREIFEQLGLIGFKPSKIMVAMIVSA